MSNKSQIRRFRALMITLAVVVATNFAISFTLNIGAGKAVGTIPVVPKPKAVGTIPVVPKPRAVGTIPVVPKP